MENQLLMLRVGQLNSGSEESVIQAGGGVKWQDVEIAEIISHLLQGRA